MRTAGMRDRSTPRKPAVAALERDQRPAVAAQLFGVHAPRHRPHRRAQSEEDRRDDERRQRRAEPRELDAEARAADARPQAEGAHGLAADSCGGTGMLKSI